MNGRRGIMKIEEFYGEKWEQMKVSFEWRRGNMVIFQQSFLMKLAEFLSIKWQQQ